MKILDTTNTHSKTPFNPIPTRLFDNIHNYFPLLDYDAIRKTYSDEFNVYSYSTDCKDSNLVTGNQTSYFKFYLSYLFFYFF